MRKRIAIIIGAVAFVLAAAYVVLCAAVRDQVIWKEVSINGVSLKGLTRDEAAQAVREKFEADYGDARVTVVLDGQEFQMEIFSVLGLDAGEEISRAYRLGHGSWFSCGAQWLKNKLAPDAPEEVTILPKVTKPEELSGIVEASGILTYSSLQETGWEVTDTELKIHKGTSGVTADGDQLKVLLENAIADHRLSEPVQCPVSEQHPQTPDFESIAAEVYRDPVSASLDKEAGYEITPSSDGVSLDAQAALASYDAAAEGTDISVPLTFTSPAITTADMEENLFSDVLGTYESRVTGDAGKKHNISLAAGFCDEVILLPGETFSYNEHIGNTTLERGFELANAYQDGDVVKEPGGGVCQVSSTIYSAVLQTDLEVIQRRFHSMIVTYVPYGMDATVSWPEPDFKFQNNHQYPIKLSVKYENDVVSVQIIGTKESDITVKCVVEMTGELSCKTYREYYDAGGNLLEREYIDSSRYKPLP